MQSELLICLLVSIHSGATQTVQPVGNASSIPHELNFSTGKLPETREEGIPFPGMKKSREFDASKVEERPSSSMSPFVTETDNNVAIETQSDHQLRFQNETNEEEGSNDETEETSILSSTETSKVILSVVSASNVTEMPEEHTEDKDDTLPPEVRAHDPFATITTSPTLENNFVHMIQNSSNNSSSSLDRTTEVDERTQDTDGVMIRQFSRASLTPEHEMIITTDGTIASEAEYTSDGTTTTMSEEHEVPVLHVNAEGTITVSAEKDSTGVTDSTVIDTSLSESESESVIESSSSQSSADVFVTERPASSSVEMENLWKVPELSVSIEELPSITTTTAKSQKQEEDYDQNGENLFVGDKTLFSQDNAMESISSSTHTHSVTSTEMSEENFGVPGFSRVEELGPEATEGIHQTEQISVPIDLTEKIGPVGEYHSGERSETTSDWFEDNEELRDISAIDESIYHTDAEKSVVGAEPNSNERNFESGPKSQPESTTTEPVLSLKNELLAISGRSREHVTDFELKVQTEVTDLLEGKGSKNVMIGMLPSHHNHVTDSHNAMERTHKTSFSFRITSIDYIPEFGDPSSGKYKKLQDQLRPDLEEIFGSLFGPIYKGIHLMGFYKSGVLVDGIVFTSVKPDDMEQLATEFEQQITARNLQIGGNYVDPRSIILDGFASKNYIERIHEGYTSSSTSSFIVGGGITISVLAILLITFTLIATNKRKKCGMLKSKHENVAVVDSNPLNLISYGIQERMATSTEPSMVTISSQMTALDMHSFQSHP